MCEQCSAKTTTYVLEIPEKADADWKDKQSVLPGYILVRATQDGNFMKKGDWGLVHCDDPDFVWTTTPTPDKFWGMADAELDLLPEHEQDAISVQEEAAYDFGAQLLRSVIESQFRMHFATVQKLMDACRVRGWDGNVSMERWLFHYLGLWIQAAKEIKHGE